jgi:hypothetical protein
VAAAVAAVLVGEEIAAITATLSCTAPFAFCSLPKVATQTRTYVVVSLGAHAAAIASALEDPSSMGKSSGCVPPARLQGRKPQTDAPSFARNKMRKARTMAIQEGNVILSTSGALDNSGKSGAKWRELCRNCGPQKCIRHCGHDHLDSCFTWQVCDGNI